MTKKTYPADDFLPFLGNLEADKLHAVLVGGQAVNVWAAQYTDRIPSLRQHQPFLSKDCDIWGNHRIAELLRERTGWTKTLFPPRGLAAASLVASDGRTIEILRSVNGLRDVDLARMGDPIQYQGQVVWVLNPVALLKAKLANAAGLDQSNRQDTRHVAILIPVVHEYLADLLARAEDSPERERKVVGALGAALTVALSPDAQPWWPEFGPGLEKLLPVEQLQKSSLPKVRNFAEKRLPRALRKMHPPQPAGRG